VLRRRDGLQKAETQISTIESARRKVEERKAMKDFYMLSSSVVLKTKKYLARSALQQNIFNQIRRGEVHSKVL
jgi:hypothetical protein